MTMLVDTHAHIYTDDFSSDRKDVIAQAIKNGVEKIFMPNIDSGSVENMIITESEHPGTCYPLMGLHPTSVNQEYKKELDITAQWFLKHRFYGVGETGIDLYWDKTFFVQQEDAFRQQLRIARTFHLPVVIHVRNSFREVFSVLEKEQDGSLTGIFHCFSGTSEEADKIIGSGFLLGIGGVVTYRNSHLGSLLKEIDLRHLVLETDSPWLSPVPNRGKRNESSYLVYIAEKIAEIYQLSVEEVAGITTDNALKLFKTGI